MDWNCVVWLRRDLRVADNPALAAAVSRGAVLPVYIYAPEEEEPWPVGAAGRVWLQHSLTSFADQLRNLGAELNMQRGDSLQILKKLILDTNADALYYNRSYEPHVIDRDKKIEAALLAQGVEVRSFKAALIFEPHEIESRAGTPFRVFTPFYKHCLSRLPTANAAPAPTLIRPPARKPTATLRIEALELMPSHSWSKSMLSDWRPGADGAAQELEVFLDSAVRRYPVDRDVPGVRGVSRLSPHLHHGEISPRAVADAVRTAARNGNASERKGADAFLRQVIWREFAGHLLFHFPSLPNEPFDPRFETFAWRRDEGGFVAWTKGQTGYPLVDAGMRELWATGWMHNRVRMVAASFLTKHLLIDWRRGARWFWDTLVDADLANNTVGWQWTAGCGVDPAPYFRIFNPVAQGERFDPDGRYVRRWVPELAGLPDRNLHRPFEAGAGVLAKAGVRPGDNYPRPLVEHKSARERALAAYDWIRRG